MCWSVAAEHAEQARVLLDAAILEAREAITRATGLAHGLIRRRESDAVAPYVVVLPVCSPTQRRPAWGVHLDHDQFHRGDWAHWAAIRYLPLPGPDPRSRLRSRPDHARKGPARLAFVYSRTQ